MKIKKIPLSKINPAEYNPRVDLKPGDPEYEKIKRSIQEFGLVELLVWNKRTGNLVGGHQRLKVLQELGYEETEVSVVDLPLKKEKALNIALNKITGDWDKDKLNAILTELSLSDFDATLTGFDATEIVAQLGQETTATDDDFNMELPAEPITKRGDVWQLGNHRLVCGDSTNNDDMGKLMFGELADLVITDPPYNVDYGEKTDTCAMLLPHLVKQEGEQT